MPARSRSRSAPRPPRRKKPVPKKKRSARRPAARPRGGFVGRDASPVLDRYPPKPGAAPPPPPVVLTAPAPLPPPPSTLPTAAPVAAPPGLLTLEKPFDLDGFSQLLGTTAIRIVVPKEHLAEVLRRVTDFMGFGIYVYSVTVRPGPDEMLRTFVVELQRVDFSAKDGRWVPFEDRGSSTSPFGPGSG